jgi:hypothetical protein
MAPSKERRRKKDERDSKKVALGQVRAALGLGEQATELAVLRTAANTLRLQQHQLEEAEAERDDLMTECARLQEALSAASTERSIALRAQDVMMQQQEQISGLQSLTDPVWSEDIGNFNFQADPVISV